MTETSRLEAAQQEAESSLEWYRSPLILLAGAILFVGVLAVIVLSVTGGDDSSAAAGDETTPPISFGGIDIPEIDAVTVTGDPLPQFAQGVEDLALGMFAPDTRATSLANGEQVILDGGRARVIGFFAHWCPHCQDELPELTTWLSENQLPPNTEFVAISTAVRSDADNYPPSAWFTDVGWNSPVVVDDADGSLMNAYGFGGFPAFIAIDATGTVVARASGNIGIDGFAELFDSFAR